MRIYTYIGWGLLHTFWKIIHVYSDTFLIYYNNLEIKFASTIEITGGIIKEGQITEINI